MMTMTSLIILGRFCRNHPLKFYTLHSIISTIMVNLVRTLGYLCQHAPMEREQRSLKKLRSVLLDHFLNQKEKTFRPKCVFFLV